MRLSHTIRKVKHTNVEATESRGSNQRVLCHFFRMLNFHLATQMLLLLLVLALIETQMSNEWKSRERLSYSRFSSKRAEN
jgi:hypothetical protein